jgi:hypothetical protein
LSEGSARRYRVGVIGFAHMHVNELVERFIASGRADIVACTHGTIVLDGADIKIYSERGAKTPTLIERGDSLPLGRSTIAEEFIHRLETGEPLHPTLDYPINLAAMAILDAGIRSADAGAARAVARVS